MAVDTAWHDQLAARVDAFGRRTEALSEDGDLARLDADVARERVARRDDRSAFDEDIEFHQDVSTGEGFGCLRSMPTAAAVRTMWSRIAASARSASC